MSDLSGNDQVLDIGYSAPELKKVLVVDDENTLQAVIQDALEGEYRLFSAFNGRKGVDMALSVKPDLILMDMMMPDLSGYEAIQLLGGDEKTRKIPVIVMTARQFDDAMVMDIKRQSNVAGLLSKPFRPKALREAIRAALERSNPSA